MENLASFYKGKKICIIGAGGYVGSRLAGELFKSGSELFLVYHKSPQNSAGGNIIVGDLSKPENFKQALDADVIFHLAAHETSQYEPWEDLEINALSVLRILEFFRKNGIFSKIIFASSSNLAGISQKQPVDESFRDNPLTIYAIHKLLAEEYLKLYARQFNVPSLILRLVNVYGPAKSLELSLRPALNRMVYNALKENSVRIFNNKDKVRDFIYIDDAVSAFLAAGAVKDPKGENYIVGSESGKSFKELAEICRGLVGEIKGKQPKIILDEVKLADIEMRDLVANSSKFKALTNWDTETDLQSGLLKTINYFKNL